MMKRFFVVCLMAFAALMPSAHAAEKRNIRMVTIAALIDMNDDVAIAHRVVNSAIVDASMQFKEKFGIEFKLVAMGTWSVPSDRFDANRELDRLIAGGHEKSDLVVAFTSKQFLADATEEIGDEVKMVKKLSAGIAWSEGNHAIVRLYDRVGMVLIHEIGHLFGAGHSTDLHSVMNGDAIIAESFDSHSAGVIIANRGRTF